MKNNILLSAATALCILSLNASALDSKNSENLEAIDVWATEIVSSSINLGQGVIETKQADHLSDLLRDIPGVDVGGTHSINNRINIRGLQDENLDISIDGAKVQNANMFHHIGNLLINPDILKKAEVQVGTNSVVNGSLGGSIAFETKDGKDMLEDGQSFGGRISNTYNSNNSLGASLSLYGKVKENIDFLLYHNYVDKNNWKDGSGVKTFGSEGKVQNSLMKVGYVLDDNQKISIAYDYLKDQGDYSPRPDFGREYNLFATGESVFATKYERKTITLKHNLDLGNNLLLDTTFYSNENVLNRKETWVGRSPRPTLTGTILGEVKTIGLNVKAQSNVETGDVLHTLTYGALYDEQTSKVEWNNEQYGENEKAKSTSIFLENAIDFDNGLLVTPGIRFNKYDFDGSYGKINDSKFTYGLSMEYSVNDKIRLLSSATTLYKGVEMVDVLASNRTIMNEVDNLKAETGMNKEIGFEYEDQNILGVDNIGFSFKYFNTDIKDNIKTEWSGGRGTIYNAGELNIKGYEAGFFFKKDKFNSLLTYAHSSSNFEKTGEPTDREPGDSLSAKLDYNIVSNLKLSWESLFMFKETDLPSGSLTFKEKESYNVHDIALNWKPQAVKGLSIIGGIDNIFDKAYVSHISDHRNRVVGGETISTSDYEPGRNIKITISYKF
jgi:hemoglobin/transferrin/lactoferrin receptor protein